MTLFETIKKLAKKQGLSLLQVNEKAGLGKMSIYNWKNKTPSISALKKVAEVLNTTVNDLINESSRPAKQGINKKSGQVVNVYPLGSDPVKMQNPSMIIASSPVYYQIRIPVINNTIKGQKVLSKKNIIDYRDLTLTHRPSGTLFLFRITEKAMLPGIPPNSVATVREQSVVKNGEIAAVLINNTVTIRRVKYINSTAFLMADNNDYDLIIADNKIAKIIGKLIHLDVNF